MTELNLEQLRTIKTALIKQLDELSEKASKAEENGTNHVYTHSQNRHEIALTTVNDLIKKEKEAEDNPLWLEHLMQHRI